MKKFILFARVYTLLFASFPLVLTAQEFNAYPNYVVIGAFAQHKNAINFTADASRNNFQAQFEMNPNRNLYYVYVLETADRELAVTEAVRLRTETKYFDTWVYSGLLGDSLPVAGVDLDPVTGQRIESVNAEAGGVSAGVPLHNIVHETDGQRQKGTALASADNGQLVTDKSFSSDRLTGDDTGIEMDSRPGVTLLTDTGEEVSAQRPGPLRVSTRPLQMEDVAGKDFYFHLAREDNHKTIMGEVEAIDFERSRKMATYPANEAVTVRLPSTESRRVSFVCQVFGYRKQQKEFNPDDPSEDLYLDDKGNLVVPFELVRLQKGDIAIMYNVFFFKDAAVMRPESRYEVNNLLELLEENPSYNIVIHGHTNGNARGKIIRMDTPGNFYSLSGTKQGFGSAKKLSEERALVIRDFLVSSGIPKGRMQVKAWGGRKPIHDAHSVRANENVRVEIEILSK